MKLLKLLTDSCLQEINLVVTEKRTNGDLIFQKKTFEHWQTVVKPTETMLLLVVHFNGALQKHFDFDLNKKTSLQLHGFFVLNIGSNQ